MVRRSTPHRYLGIATRTAHLGAVVGLLAAAWAGAPAYPWNALVLITGCLLVGDELWRFGLDWLRWVQAWAILGKLVVFGAFSAAGHPVWGLWVAFAIGSVISHAPGELRHAAIVGNPGPCASRKGEAPSASVNVSLGARAGG